VEERLGSEDQEGGRHGDTGVHHHVRDSRKKLTEQAALPPRPDRSALHGAS